MRYKSLDFWRGVACLLVIVFHSTFHAQERAGLLGQVTQHLWIGVPIFFVISGYCIAAAADSAAKKGRPAGEFFWRRFKRIYPPYWILFGLAAVLVTGLDKFVAPVFSSGPHPIARINWLDGWQLLGNLTLTESWRDHVFGSGQKYFLGHAWTLVFEEQFYAVCGIGLVLFRRHLFAFYAAITLATLGLMHLPVGGFFFDGHWLEFAAGIAVFYALNHGYTRTLCAVLAAAWLVQWAVADDWVEASRAVAFGFGLLLVLIHQWDEGLHESKAAMPVRWCGVMCYSLYLVHWPICKGVSELCWRAGAQSDAAIAGITLPLCIASSILAGWLFHVSVERRFLNAPLRPRSIGFP